MHRALMDAARVRGQSATTLVREAIETWLQDWQEQQLNAELDAYIAAEAGGPNDLDPLLAQASEEHLLETR